MAEGVQLCTQERDLAMDQWARCGTALTPGQEVVAGGPPPRDPQEKERLRAEI